MNVVGGVEVEAAQRFDDFPEDVARADEVVGAPEDLAHDLAEVVLPAAGPLAEILEEFGVDESEQVVALAGGLDVRRDRPIPPAIRRLDHRSVAVAEFFL